MQPAETTAPGASSPRLARIIEALETPSRYSGEFVAYWAVIAVFAYYYEVIARDIFNSPTNWVHEGMFLMFGMMFLISGAYALRSNSHVRVDIFYSRFSARGKALIDLSTSIFFFIFAGTLLVTGWTFFSDSFEVREVSFTEWAIQYYPVKTTIVIGAVLILLQGIAKMLADLSIVLRPADKMTAN
jgi:TRAP-type mannitol/chloroaromatic compound transport system permease small subunit